MPASTPPSPVPALSRRRLFGSGLALASLIGLSACSTGSRGGEGENAGGAASSAATDSFPVEVEHALGTTTVETEPKRVVTIGGSNNQDFVAALGVVPVGVATVAWGGNDQGSTDWFDRVVSDLGAEKPQQFDEADGTNFTAVAELTPDLIVAVNSGITQEDYDRLSKIAPVVAYPTGPWVSSWQDQQRAVAKALGRSRAGEELVTDAEDLMAQQSEQLGDAAGKTFIYGDTSQKLGFHGPGDARCRFFREIGLTVAPVVEKNIPGEEFWREWPEERADELESDLYISFAEDRAAAEKFENDPILRSVPAVAAGHTLFTTDKKDVVSTMAPSPLSLPYAVEVYVPAVRDALGSQSS